MKKQLFCILTSIIINEVNFANSSEEKIISPEIKKEAKQCLPACPNWPAGQAGMQNQPVQFLENKGQMADEKGNLIPFVLFKTSAPGMDMYVTEKGLTYLFLKAEEEKEEKESEPGHPAHDKNSFSKRGKKKTEWSRIDMELKGAAIRKENILKENPLATDFNFFYGHCPNGIYGVKQYEKITIKNIYSNIDWVLYNSSNQGFKYDFIVHPGADPAQIEFVYSSLNLLKLNQDGSIKMKTKLGILTEQAPYSYIKENNKQVSTEFQITSQQHINKEYYQTTIRMKPGAWNPQQTLIIDPQLVWGTFFDGNVGTTTSNCGIMSTDCDANGNLFVTGYTGTTNFPVVDPGGSVYFDGTVGNGGDVFISRFSATGSLTWSTYYGGDNSIEYSASLDVGATGNVYVTGYTYSDDFPTFNPLGSAYYDGTFADICCIEYDVFILCFSNAGVRNWATYYGDLGYDGAYSITSDAAGNIYVAGHTAGLPGAVFNTQPGTGAFAGAYYDGIHSGADNFLLRFSPTYTLEWATFYGDGGSESWTGCAITTDVAGNLYVTGNTVSTTFPTQPGIGAFSGAYYDNTLDGGEDAFILRFSNTGTLEWATYYGGNGIDFGLSIKTDLLGNIYVTGVTQSTDFPTQPGMAAFAGAYYDPVLGGSQDAFMLRFDAAGVRTWATYYGGSDLEYPSIVSWGNIAIDTCGNTYISFTTMSADMDTLNPGCGYYDGIYSGGSGTPNFPEGDIFLTEFSKTGRLLWATYIGGSNDDFRNPLAIDKNNNFYLCGEWTKYTAASSAGMPVIDPGGAYYDNTPNGGDDAFIIKFRPARTAQHVNPICNCNGSATVNVCVAPPVNYVWSNGSSTINTTNLSNTISNLCAGNYWVEITDASCNRDTLFYTLADSNSIFTFNTNVVNVLCKGDSTGSVTVNAGAGTSPYTYSWSPAVGNSSAVTALGAGSYTVTVMDANGCDSTLIITITEPPTALTATVNSTTTSCNNSNGTATVTANGGTPSYTYNWNNNQTTQTATGLPAGNYTVSVSDSNGCIRTSTVTVASSNGPTVTLAWQTNVLCKGDYTGNAAINVIGGTLPYAYLWNTIPAQNTATVTGLTAGTYSVLITDANNCTAIQTVTIIEPAAITASITTSAASCNSNNGEATVMASGGTGAFSYVWNPTNQFAPTATALATGSYTVTVTDANGCASNANAMVAELPCPCPANLTLALPNAFSPNSDGENDKFCLPAGQAGLQGGMDYCIRELKIIIYNRWGEKVYESDDKDFCWEGTYKGKLQNPAVFVYYMEAILTNGNEVKKKGNVSLIK